jgi:hypothetical protein
MLTRIEEDSLLLAALGASFCATASLGSAVAAFLGVGSGVLGCGGAS